MFESSTLLTSLHQSWTELTLVLPDVALAVALLVAGWLVAKLLRRLTVIILKSLKTDEFAERSGLDDFLVRGRIPHTTVTLVGGAVYWLVLGGVFVALLDALGWPTADVLVGRITQFVPNLVLAVGILVFGSLLSRIVGGLVFSYLSNIGTAGADTIGALARYATLVFVFFMAAEQLAIRTEILVSAFQIAFAALCLALALAFGLGGRDWAAQVIARHSRK